MKVRLIISDRCWEYRLQAAPQEPGKYFVKLAALDGGQLKPTVAVGPFPSLDAIQETAEKIYLRLVAMMNANKAAGAQNDGLRETTVNHSVEHSQN